MSLKKCWDCPPHPPLHVPPTPGASVVAPAKAPTYRIFRVQGVVFAVGKHPHQLKDLVVNLSDEVCQDVPSHSPELDLLQLQELDSGFIEVLVEGKPSAASQQLCTNSTVQPLMGSEASSAVPQGHTTAGGQGLCVFMLMFSNVISGTQGESTEGRVPWSMSKQGGDEVGLLS